MNNLELLKQDMSNLGVAGDKMSSTLYDVLEIMTDESGGNPYAINDNTTGVSHPFTTQQAAEDYIRQNPNHTMAIGLFQLLTPGGMGAAAKDPMQLLDVNTQYQIALPQLLKNIRNADSKYSPASAAYFEAVAGNDWAADTAKYGGRGAPSAASVMLTQLRLSGGVPGRITEMTGQVTGGVTNAVNGTLDYIKNLFSVNSLIMIVGIVAIFMIVVHIAEGK